MSLLGALADAFGFGELAVLQKELLAFDHLFLYACHSPDRSSLCGDVVGRPEDFDFIHFGDEFTGKAVDFLNGFDFIKRHFDADNRVSRSVGKFRWYRPVRGTCPA